MTIDGVNNKNYAADALVRTGAGTFYGITVNNHTSGTFKVIDGTSAGSGRVIHDTVTPASGPYVFTPPPSAFTTGLYIDIGGTINYTVHFKEA